MKFTIRDRATDQEHTYQVPEVIGHGMYLRIKSGYRKLFRAQYDPKIIKSVEGDTLDSLSLRYGRPLRAIAEWNPEIKEKILKPGTPVLVQDPVFDNYAYGDWYRDNSMDPDVQLVMYKVLTMPVGHSRPIEQIFDTAEGEDVERLGDFLAGLLQAYLNVEDSTTTPQTDTPTSSESADFSPSESPMEPASEAIPTKSDIEPLSPQSSNPTSTTS
jgi:hypothetical protein